MLQKSHKHIRVHGLLSSASASNPQVLALWKRKCIKTTVDEKLFRVSIESSFADLPFFIDTTFMGDAHEPLQNYASVRDSYLKLSPQETRHGFETLATMGVSRPFICIHCRDKAYLDQKHDYNSREEWAYHDFRDARIDTYTNAAYYLTQNGFDVIRMGNVVEEPFSFPDNPHIFDYANSGFNSPLMDVFLLANCEFLLGGCTGLTQLATLMGTRVAVANWCHLELSSCFFPGDIIMPKDYMFDQGDHMEAISLEKQLALGIGHIVHGDRLKESNIILINNLPEDILELAKEAIAEPCKETDDLAFYDIMDDQKYLCRGTPVKLATHYAKTRPWFLERKNDERKNA